MSFLGRFIWHTLAAVIFIAVSGCTPPEPGQLEEEKELHFVRGNNDFNAMDYHSAIDEFRQALEANPRSAQAHYRLAQLFDTKEPDPASAIFHYQEFLRLNPRADNPDIIQQRISTCKQQLAADVLQMPSAPATMKKIEELSEANRLLQQQVDRLTETNRQWNAYFASEQAARKNNPAMPPDQLIASQSPDDMTAPGPTITKLPPARPKPVVKPRTHVVASRETFASIARKHNVTITALQAANPGVAPKKLRIGQSLNLPP
jgi:LysM repeat protein